MSDNRIPDMRVLSRLLKQATTLQPLKPEVLVEVHGGLSHIGLRHGSLTTLADHGLNPSGRVEPRLGEGAELAVSRKEAKLTSQ